MEAVCGLLARHERKYNGRDEIWNTNLAVNSECGSVVVKGRRVDLGHLRLKLLCHISPITLVLGTSKEFYSWDVWEHITFYTTAKKDLSNIMKLGSTLCVYVYVKKGREGCLCKCVCVEDSILENHCFAPLSLGGSWFLAGMMNIVLVTTLKCNTTISDCPQLIPLKMSTVHMNSSLLFPSAFHSGTCRFEISFMCQSKTTFSVCPKTLITLWPQSTSKHFNFHWHV